MPAAPADLPADDYTLGRTSAEYQRLRWQAQLWEQATARLLAQTGLGPGQRCLDVGCGPGEVMRLMAGLVGPSGQVTGLDTDARLGQEAVSILRATVPGQFAFVQADVRTATAVPGGPFDLVYARLLLSHLSDPAAAVRQLHAWTRPGGTLLVTDFDCQPMGVFPELATWPEFTRVLSGMYAISSGDTRLGAHLPLHFAAAGLGPPDGTDVAGLLAPLPEVGAIFRALYQSLRPGALRLGLTTEADGAAFLAELDAAIGRPGTVAMTPLLVSAWKRKPAD